MINYEMALSEIEMYKKAHESLVENLEQANKKTQQYKNERDTLIDDVAILKANNERLMRRNQKLESYVRMWDKVKDWKKKELEKDSNNILLHDLSDKMNRLERDMYKGRG